MDDQKAIQFWNGQLLELETSQRKVYFTEIIQHEPNLIIQRPVSRKGTPLLLEGENTITVYFHDQDQGLCTFDSKITQYQNGKTVIEKPLTKNIKKAQRRRYFRVQVAVEMNLVLPSTKDSAGEKLFVHTYDISGGGAAFIFRHPVVKVGDLVNGSLQFKINSVPKNINFSGRIVNVMKQEYHFYRISLQFMAMNELIRTDIIKFCMYKQIELRKKTKNES